MPPAEPGNLEPPVQPVPAAQPFPPARELPADPFDAPRGGILKQLLLFVALVGAALAGIALWAYYPRSHTLTEQSLQFTHVQRGTMRDAVSATGRLEPREVIGVASEVPGFISTLLVRPGDVVVEGTVLATLDDYKARLDLDEAAAGVEAAKAGWTQALAIQKGAEIAYDYQKEIEKQGGFRSERDKAQVQVEVAQAGVGAAKQKVHAAEIALKKAHAALDKTRIRAPLRSQESSVKTTFLVLDRRAQVGQVVGPHGSPLFVLTPEVAVMEVHTQVAEGDIARVRKGLAATFTVSAFADDDIEFRGTVKEIRPMALSTQGAVYYDTLIEVANQKDPDSGEWRLRPGMTASVDIIRREHKNVWKVPTVALNFQLDPAYLSDAAKAHVDDWQARPQGRDWQPLWIWDQPQKRPWPVFVRLRGTDKNGESGLKDSEFNEILEWEPGREPRDNETPRIIIGAPPAHAPGFFEQPINLKVS